MRAHVTSDLLYPEWSEMQGFKLNLKKNKLKKKKKSMPENCPKKEQNIFSPSVVGNYCFNPRRGRANLKLERGERREKSGEEWREETGKRRGAGHGGALQKRCCRVGCEGSCAAAEPGGAFPRAGDALCVLWKPDTQSPGELP